MSTRPRSALLLLAALLLSCHPPAHVTYRGVDSNDDFASGETLQISLRLFVGQGKKERPVQEGEALHSGDDFSLLLRASQQAYLYVVHFAPDGSPSVLFPDADLQIIPAGCAVRIPQSGALHLQPPNGLEHLHVAASLRPLPQADRRLCEDLQLPCAELLSKKSPQLAACDGKKGLLSAVKIGKASERGVASVRLSFQHDP